MKSKKVIAIFLMLAMLVSLAAACGSEETDNGSDATDNGQVVAPPEDLEEGADTNNGRPYNLTPQKFDSRNDRYLNGINATVLPITDEEVVIDYWTSFNSTIMQGLDESEVFKEMEERTGVKVNFVYPPVGQEADNFNLRINSNELPHIFRTPPEYTGGYQKAVEDGVYLELTDYYDRGLMPNVQYLREANADINRDIVDDEGRMYFFPMIDIVPSHPWSGLWIRQDWLDELGLDMPTTIDEWDHMLREMKDAYNVAPLALNLDLWYGVATNFMFAGSYDAGYEWINKDGEAAYGPILDGYKDFLTTMNKWYEDGLIDPDFATRDTDSYNANAAAGNVGALGLAYGELGQIIVTGKLDNPDFSLKPALMPTSYDGQTTRLRQDNSTVRGDREYVTTRVVDDGIDDIFIQWKDYWYSQDGGDLCSYGPEGVSYVWREDGEFEWIYPRLEEEEDLDFWTIYPLFKLHNWGYLRNSAAYEFIDEVHECIEVWSSQDSSWLVPDNISHTSEESRELASIMMDINTLRDEMSPKFIIGQEPLENFDAFVTNVKNMNIDRAIEIKTAALERYYARD